jgi:malonate decarboxylase beta subunit
MGIVARCCDSLIINEEGRMGLSGPEVIESTMGVEEFDASDRALVWRTFGGKHRFLLGEVQCLVDDDIAEFRQAVIHVLDQPADKITLESMEHEHETLKKRLADYGQCQNSYEIWQRMGFDDPAQLPLLNINDFLNLTRELNRGQS